MHLHGSASLAPYDGWAEDETCLGETKDYVFPNNRPVTGCYHDHALHITARNAYYGLAGKLQLWYFFVTMLYQTNNASCLSLMQMQACIT